ncbi:MAG: hypothetical protein HMLIMOIP_002226 [Candidatus Nitrosomirales archaeon]|jgi:hypothetical protein
MQNVSELMEYLLLLEKVDGGPHIYRKYINIGSAIFQFDINESY